MENKKLVILVAIVALFVMLMISVILVIQRSPDIMTKIKVDGRGFEFNETSGEHLEELRESPDEPEVT